MSKETKKHKTAPKAARKPQERSATSGKATTPPATENAPNALVEAMREAGGDIATAAEAVELALGNAEGLLDGYLRLVADDGPKARDTVVGVTDMDVTSAVARIASSSVAMLGRLLAGREARAMAVSVEDMTRLATGARAAAAYHAIALEDCLEAAKRVSSGIRVTARDKA